YIGGDNAVTDGAQRNGETFFFGRDLSFKTFSLSHIAHHRDVEPLLVDDHFAQRHFDREGDVLARSHKCERATAGGPHDLGPVTNDRLRVVLALITLRHQTGKVVPDHFVVATAEHFFCRGIHCTDDAVAIDGDHAVETVLDSGAT